MPDKVLYLFLCDPNLLHPMIAGRVSSKRARCIRLSKLTQTQALHLGLFNHLSSRNIKYGGRDNETCQLQLVYRVNVILGGVSSKPEYE